MVLVALLPGRRKIRSLSFIEKRAYSPKWFLRVKGKRVDMEIMGIFLT
jgi:hypothetical protein